MAGDGGTGTTRRLRKKRGRLVSAKGIKSSQHSHIDDHDYQIVPVWIQIAVVLNFLFLGIATEHFQRTRSQAPIFSHHLRISSLQQEHRPASPPVGNASTKKEAARIQLYEENQDETLLHPIKNDNPKRFLGTSLLSAEDDQALEFDPKSGDRYHLIFSTDCSPYQHWQSYLVYFTAMEVRQPGHVTRIVSGCTDHEAKLMQDWFDHQVQYMSERFHIHLTPKFSEVQDENGQTVEYKFFNKPFGLKHFLEHFPLLSFDNGSFADHEGDIVILIDPDMPLTRPITSDFSNERETLIAPRRQGEFHLANKVQNGVPFAQSYGLGTQWQRFDLEKIAGPDSPALKVDKEEGSLYYPAGPPYLGTVHDMYQIATKWTEFVPKVHEQYPHLLAEMYAYCIAAAHLGLRHQLVSSLMVSNPGTGGEAWPLIDKIPAPDMCQFAKKADHDVHALPSVVHLCQRYSVGEEWFFGKRKIPGDIFECETPLFIEPPADIALKYDFKKPPNAPEPTPLTPQLVHQHTFMVCFLTALINDASIFYKANACPATTANLKKSRRVADLFDGFRESHPLETFS